MCCNASHSMYDSCCQGTGNQQWHQLEAPFVQPRANQQCFGGLACGITGRGAADDQTPAAAGSGRPFQPRRGSPAAPRSTKQHDDTKNVIHSSEMTRSVTIHPVDSCQVDLQRQGRDREGDRQDQRRNADQRNEQSQLSGLERNRAFFDRCPGHAIFR